LILDPRRRPGSAPDVRVTHHEIDPDEYTVVRFETPVRIPEGLTPAERDVVEHILSGASNVDIARVRGTSSRTVANQVASIFRKLGVQSRAELARLCARASRT
jgi:DNA-binding CsgD family transcriptional regulator